MPDVPLTDQLACAKRELTYRRRAYPALVQKEEMLERVAVRELAAMTAIVRTFTRLVEAEAAHRQPGLWGGETWS